MAPPRKRKRARQHSPSRPHPIDRAPRTARQVVFRALEQHAKTGAFLAETINTLADEASLSPRDRALSRELGTGVIRRRATLDCLIQTHLNRPWDRVEDSLQWLLRMGAYELAFLESIPSHASVNETTELARFLRRPRWTGFLNGTLRAVDRDLTDDTLNHPAANAFPVAPGVYRVCRTPVFPDPQSDEQGYFASAFSFPRWLVDRWAEGNVELSALGFWFNLPQDIVLRINPLRSSVSELLQVFHAADIPAEALKNSEAIRLLQSRKITDLPGFAEGHFSVQDATAMKAVQLLNPQPGETIWDVCAAPGTKTMAMAEQMQNRDKVVATDISEGRLSKISENADRLGLDIIEPRLMSAEGTDAPSGPFDAVMVDVPCSNTGVLGKRPEARWRLSPADFRELPQLQVRLLESAIERTRPGGRVVYSTCSIDRDENESVVQAVLAKHSDWTLIQQDTHWPGQPFDGGYAALLQSNANK